MHWLLNSTAAGWSLALALLFALALFLAYRRGKYQSPARRRRPNTSIQIDEDLADSTDTVPLRESLATRRNSNVRQFDDEQRGIGRTKTAALKHYDVFLSYNREDVGDVETIHEYLTDAGLRAWLDLKNIAPGQDWLEAMQDGLANASSCLVFYRNESGVWQREETKAAIRKKAEDASFKVIPVLLPGGGDHQPRLPPLLMGTAWVDLRAGLFNVPALKSLIDAIRGGQIVPLHSMPEKSQSNNELPIGYRADVKKIISLLIGEALYSRRDVCVRELIQNAVDACERQDNYRFGAESRASVIVNIDTKNGFFEVRDNGDGMSPRILEEYFAVIGKSIKDEENVIERTQGDEKTRMYLISKFGIGFISVYMLAKKILISTTAEGFEQINIEIDGISEPFIYHDSSKVGRRSDEIGTTVRVYLRPAFLAPSDAHIDVLASVQEFCRHVQFVTVIKDGRHVKLRSDWNTGAALVSDVTTAPFKFELHLALSVSNLDFLGSNAGFLINKRTDAISPEHMPSNIGGEINFYPGTVDLNMARDTIIANEKSSFVRNLISRSIRRLLIKAASSDDQEIRKRLKKILFVYMDEALKLERDARKPSLNTGRSSVEVEDLQRPPLSSIEAAELLMDVWIVKLPEKECSLREALRVVKEQGKHRAYLAGYYYDKPLLSLIEQSLRRQGFLVIDSGGGDITFKSGKSEWVSARSSLKYLSQRYMFDFYEVEKPLEADVIITTSAEKLSFPMRSLLKDIETSTGKSVPLAKLPEAPIVFELHGKNFLNVESESFIKLERIFEQYDPSLLKSYIQGLLQYDIS